MNIIYSGM